jgi:nucleoside-diphosphate-sugar epimerase
MEKLRVALLGATSHIAKGLIASWSKRGDHQLLLYARSTERVRDFLSEIGTDSPTVLLLDEFGVLPFDVVVNCIGIGDPGRLVKEAASIFTLTESWDNRVLDYLYANPETLYIYFSSGAAYGTDFSKPVDDKTFSSFPLNNLTPGEYYGIAKLNAEAKHRAMSGHNIVDLRVFSYFSRFIDLSTRFLLSDIAQCLKTGECLKTTSVDFFRDYAHPDDLVSLVDLCVRHRRFNGVYDLYSSKPVGKFEMLEALKGQFGLSYCVEEIETVNATGSKQNYYSQNHRAAELGYLPVFSSLESLCLEMQSLLSC